MTGLVVRTDGILPIEPEDVAVLAADGLEYREAVCRTEDEVIAAADGASGLLILAEPITARVLDAVPSIRVVGRFGVGLDTIDLQAARDRGVAVVYVPDANTGEVAAHAMAHILALVRRLPQHDAAVQSGTWSYLAGGVGTRRLTDLTVGVLGFGRIGRLVAEAARGLGFGVVVHDPFVPSERITDAGFEAVDLGGLLERGDVVSVHVPLSAETRGIIGAAAIAAMRPGAIVVNVSRGGLIDEDALAAAVRSGHLAGAGIDTTSVEPLPMDSPLRGHPSILLSPHAAHYSQESLRETVHRAFVDVANVLAGRAPRDPVF